MFEMMLGVGRERRDTVWVVLMERVVGSGQINMSDWPYRFIIVYSELC